MSAALDPLMSALVDLLWQHTGAPVVRITPEARFVEDLDCDSLDEVEIVVAIEDRFGIEVTDDEGYACRTVGAALDLLKAKGAKA